jgi:hypothetical protein
MPSGAIASLKILGDHPVPPHPFGKVLDAQDGQTETKIHHRSLTVKSRKKADAVVCIRKILIQHHASPEALMRTKEHCEAMKRLGFGPEQGLLRRFPTNPSTQKGNLAEVVLAEYVEASCSVMLPVYRLRYNPNIDQSMKGDDVLAFDLDAKPVRIIVGEAKFRENSSASAVKEIVDGLLKSYKGGVPASLQFIADRLFESGQIEFGTRVLKCAELFARGQLQLDYIGMLLSDTKSAGRVDKATPNSLHRLAMISFGVLDPNSLVDACYKDLE